MAVYYFPGCALQVYKPALADKIISILHGKYSDIRLLNACCKRDMPINADDMLFTACPGCENRLSKKYNTKTVWQVLADIDYVFPNYGGLEISMHDSCNIRGREDVYDGTRKLLDRMNIKVVESKYNRGASHCCGASLVSKLSIDELEKHKSERLAEFPANDIAVHCMGCTRNLYERSKTIHHLADLVAGEKTELKSTSNADWDRWKLEYADKVCV
ncbi:hypothetical protein RsTz2092_09030 [Deferribacterales bacterium RsTz2092]|nr:hypothetical protein AGMMS49941_06770 [Deferribacterales bacterium]